MKRLKRRLLLILSLLSVFAPVGASAERILIRGARGPILVNRGGGFQASPSRFTQLSPTLFSVNGRLFERDRFGQFRPLGINRNTGELVAFDPASRRFIPVREPQSASDLASLYARGINENRFTPEQRAIIDPFLRTQGIAAGNPNGQFPGGGPVASSGGQFNPGGGPPGPHGNGSGPAGDPAVSRRPAEAIPVGGDGKVLPSACQNMTAAICGSVDPRQEESLTRSNEATLINSYVANTSLGQQVGRGQFNRIATNILGNTSGLPAQVYSDFMNKAVQQIPNLNGVIQSVRANLTRAIETEFADDPATRQIMFARMNAVNLIFSPPFDPSTRRLEPRALQDFVEGCGPFGMAPGAFSIPSAPGHPSADLFICPGMLHRAFALGGADGLESYLMHVLGHEWTHHFGADRKVNQRGQVLFESPVRGAYQKLLACLRVPEAEQGETAADFMGIKTLVQRLRGASPEQAFRFMKNAMSPLCHSEGDGVHPNGNERIGVTFGKDKDVLTLIGLPTAPERLHHPRIGENMTYVRILVFAGLLALSAFAAEEGQTPGEIPQVTLTRVFEHGGSESLKLRCTKDVKGDQEFFCELLRFRNGVEVSQASMYSKQTKAILGSFFELFPSGLLVKPEARSGEKVTEAARASDPSYVWDVSYRAKAARGYVLRSERERDARVMRAVLSLEGALAAQFYR